MTNCILTFVDRMGWHCEQWGQLIEKVTSVGAMNHAFIEIYSRKVATWLFEEDGRFYHQ